MPSIIVCFKMFFMGSLLDTLYQNAVEGVPVRFLPDTRNEESRATYGNIQIVEDKEKKTESYFNIDENEVEKFVIDSTTERGQSVSVDTDFVDHMVSFSRSNPVKRRQARRSTQNSNAATESTDGKKEGENESRASSIPFLPKGDSDASTSSSSGLSSIPGLSQVPGLSSIVPEGSGSTATAVLGGFSLVLVPMPGLSAANIGSALQGGQQMSQFLSAMPTLPG